MQRLVHDPPAATFDIDLPYVNASVDLLGWMKLLTAALRLDGHRYTRDRNRLGHGPGLEPMLFIRRREPCSPHDSLPERSTLTLQHFAALKRAGTWRQGWQPKPHYPHDLYQFDVCLADHLCFRHTFFGDLDHFVIFRASGETVEKISGQLRSVVGDERWSTWRRPKIQVVRLWDKPSGLFFSWE